MEQFNYWIVGLLAVLTILVIKVSLKYANSAIEKFYVIFIAIFTFVYSGVGIAFEEVERIYIFSYISFIVLLLVGMLIGFRVINVKKEYKFLNSLTGVNRWIINISTLLYWAIILIKLVYPNNRLPYMFNISITVNDVFENQIINRSNSIVYSIGLVLLLIRPFYYIFLYKMKSTVKAAVLIALEIYIGVVINGYIGRSGLIVSILMILFIIVFKKYNNKFDMGLIVEKPIRKSVYNGLNYKKDTPESSNEQRLDNVLYKKYIKIFSIALIISTMLLPLLFDYQNIRLGVAASNTSVIEKVSELFKIECGFPKLYDEAEQFSNVVSPVNYFKWLATLVIPKKIFSVSNLMLINYDFSTFITGVQYGYEGFNVYLPSILGEGIILYGPNLAWIHGLFLGLISGIFCSLFSKSKVMSLWNIYILFQLLFMARGGSQGTISMFINGSVLLMICVGIDAFIVKKEGY